MFSQPATRYAVSPYLSPVKKALQWVFSVWIVAITGRYAATTWKTFHNPFTAGHDFPLFEKWIALCVLLVITAVLVPPKIFTRGILALCGLAAAAILILSHSLFPAIIAVWLVLICVVAGVAILSRFHIQMTGVAEHVALAVPVGMAALALLILALALGGALRERWIVLALLAVSTMGVLAVRDRTLRVPPWNNFGNVTREAALLIALIAMTALLNLTWAVAPEIQYDSLNYHLAIPKIYLQAGRLVDVRFMHAYLARLVESDFTAGLAIGGQTAVKLIVFALGLFAATATYALGAALFGSRAAMWAAAFFYTTPLVDWLTGTAYIDHIIALFCAAGFLAFVKWVETGQSGWFYAASIIAGMATGSKLNAGLPFMFVLPLMAIGLRRQWRAIAAGALLFLLIAVPYYAITWAYTGNPVFPFYNGIFKSPYWPEVNTLGTASNFNMPATLSNLLRFPFRLTLETSHFGEEAPRGVLGLTLLLAFPFAGYLLPRYGKAVYALIATIV